MGKTVYLTDLELEMITLAFDECNRSFEMKEDAEERCDAADNILRKVSK